MTSNEIKQKSDLIWSKLFCLDGENLSKEEQIKLISTIIRQVSEEQRKIGRRQILNHFDIEIQNLQE